MLSLKGITKDYISGDTTVHALKGVSLEFSDSEFVSILGPSGCGKTTLLNIIGGLDRYSDGDLAVNGTSTKKFRDRDWDTYRNHSIGFIFQTYNLIPHQTVLKNVELALTLSGVSVAERRRRATDVLTQVGLADQLGKRPNQMSGGQMQRVAIARALVNNPDIILADEPTGALDTETSVQVMDILKVVAKDRLVIMVTHNPDLAEKYSTRIIRLVDGNVISDDKGSAEHAKPSPLADKVQPETGLTKKRASMSFFTAMSLSLNNLLTKKARTFMTAFAGSIGIIGIALIMSLSNGVQEYINNVEKDTLSSYPISIEQSALDISSLISTSAGVAEKDPDRVLDKIYTRDIMGKMLNTVVMEYSRNDLQAFRTFIESKDKDDPDGIKAYASDIKYSYSTPLNIYKADTTEKVTQVNPNRIFSGMSGMMGGGMMSGMMNTNVWQELIGGNDILKTQYDVLAGKLPEKFNEVVLVVDDENGITDYTLYSLGIKDSSELSDAMRGMATGEKVAIPESGEITYSYDEVLGWRFKLFPNSAYYAEADGIWVNKNDDSIYMKKVVDEAETIEVVGILRPSENSAVSSVGGTIGYAPDLMYHLIDSVNASGVVNAQKSLPDVDIFTGLPFENGEDEEASAADAEFDISSLPPEQQEYLMGLSEEERASVIANAATNNAAAAKSNSTYEKNLESLGAVDIDTPASISIYPKDFEAKDKITSIIEEYNKAATDRDDEKSVIRYMDLVGLMMSSVSNIISTISMVLIAFVAISLIVSSIMIGIITYISVLERTKEIGVLRSIGASKGDISRVFNAETLIVGFVSGTIGIIVTVLLCIPANIIIKMATDINNVAQLPIAGGVGLIIISMALTLIAGLFPSRVAAKKDPVVALRTE
ncbi:ABC transporter [Clostridia bacterium]|nr:ABC transporter [Clostridia bacterium]